MSGTRRRLLDSYAILALLNDEAGGEDVADHLGMAIREGDTLLVSEISVGEVFYIVARHRSMSDAERVRDHLETLPLEWVANNVDDVLAAARIKASHAISYADAFAVATAVRHDATVVTGDREFESVERLLRVEWI
jgi:ribonuclease VapC